MSHKNKTTSTKSGQDQRSPGGSNAKKRSLDHLFSTLSVELRNLSRVSPAAIELSKQLLLRWLLCPLSSAHVLYWVSLKAMNTWRLSSELRAVNSAYSFLSSLSYFGLGREVKDFSTGSLLLWNDLALSMDAVMN